MQPENPRAVAGDNQPPEPTPFEKVRDRIELLYQQASDYLDGEPIATQGMADDIGNLMDMIRKAEKEADALRKDEVKPFDEAKAEVQARYAPLISDTKSVRGKTVLAIEACKKALAPWLQKLADEQAAAAKAAREAAEKAQREAEAALREADPDNLAARATAEDLIQQAAATYKAADKVAKAKAHAGGGGGRSAHLRTYYDGVVVDGRAFHAWCVKHDRDAMTAYLARRAQELTAAGQRSIPGVEVRERKEVA